MSKILVNVEWILFESNHDISQFQTKSSREDFRSSRQEVIRGKGILKICSKLLATLLKSLFGMGFLLYICCIFSENLFPGTPLGGCLWDFAVEKFLKSLWTTIFGFGFSKCIIRTANVNLCNTSGQVSPTSNQTGSAIKITLQ